MDLGRVTSHQQSETAVDHAQCNKTSAEPNVDWCEECWLLVSVEKAVVSVSGDSLDKGKCQNQESDDAVVFLELFISILFSAIRDNQLPETTFTYLSSDSSHPNPQRCCRDEHGVREDLDPHVDAHRVRVLEQQ
jgi:hypothetical protein